LFPKGFSVDDGQFFAFGLAPEIRTGEPLTDFQRVGKIMGLLGAASSLSVAQDVEVKRIKDTLKPGQKVASLLVSCVGRPDYGHTFVAKLRAANVSSRLELLMWSSFLYRFILT
jgi:hypothetical protein